MTKNNIDGWLVIDKESGLSSNQVLSQVKKILNPTKAGYIGTLDPAAEGVLPIALGEATKIIQFLGQEIKAYEFTVNFGFETDTYDLEGTILSRTEKIPSELEILKIIDSFTGKIKQIPPKYSAIKIGGVRSYKLARAGQEVEIPEREIEIFDFKLIRYNEEKNTADFYVKCSQGTYVRSLGVDLAKKLNSLAAISNIKRIRSGCFEIDLAIKLDNLKKIVYNGELKDKLMSVEFALGDIPVIDLTQQMKLELKQGKIINLSSNYNDGLYLSKYDNKIVAIGIVDKCCFKSRRVFNY